MPLWCNDRPHSVPCTSLPEFQLGGAVVAILVAIPLITVGIKLRKVHDAFYQKNELKLLALTTIIMVTGVVTANFSLWGSNIAAFALVCWTCISFTTPSILALRKSYFGSSKSSSS